MTDQLAFLEYNMPYALCGERNFDDAVGIFLLCWRGNEAFRRLVLHSFERRFIVCFVHVLNNHVQVESCLTPHCGSYFFANKVEMYYEVEVSAVMHTKMGRKPNKDS
jgi:hypothetical protein